MLGIAGVAEPTNGDRRSDHRDPSRCVVAEMRGWAPGEQRRMVFQGPSRCAAGCSWHSRPHLPSVRRRASWAASRSPRGHTLGVQQSTAQGKPFRGGEGERAERATGRRMQAGGRAGRGQRLGEGGRERRRSEPALPLAANPHCQLCSECRSDSGPSRCDLNDIALQWLSHSAGRPKQVRNSQLLGLSEDTNRPRHPCCR